MPCSRIPEVGLRATTRMHQVGAHVLLYALALLVIPVESRGQTPITEGPPAPQAIPAAQVAPAAAPVPRRRPSR